MLDRLEKLLEWGGTRRDVALLSVSGFALLLSMLDIEPLPFGVAWIAIVLCGVPIVLEAVLGLAAAWDIKADVLVSIGWSLPSSSGRTLPRRKLRSSCSSARCLRT